MVQFAQDHSQSLRQNYNRAAPGLATQVGRYGHAKQYKRDSISQNQTTSVHRRPGEVADLEIGRPTVLPWLA
jgi:hypothetical protein